MEGFCRGCLIQYNDPIDLLHYTEKNRRLFVYSTGIQVKRNDAFAFQLCKNCYLNLKVCCKFKKMCRNSDKKIRSFVSLKDTDESVDFCTFLKNSDDSFVFRLPMLGNCTPGTNKNKEDDNESTCTSIQNFMSDILESEEIPATEARIIREVIEEEADVLDDSLDSHWLQDDASIDTDFKLDFSFSPFSTPQYLNNDDHCYTPKKVVDETTQIQGNGNKSCENHVSEYIDPNHETINEGKCVIDRNLDNALQNEDVKNFSLDNLLVTPPLYTNLSAPSTPLITNILFGDKLESDTDDSSMHKVGQCIETFESVPGDTEIIESFFMKEASIKEEKPVVETVNENAKENNNEIENRYENSNVNKIENEENQRSDRENCINNASSEETKLLIETIFNIKNFYCKICEKKFKSLVALKVHSSKAHNLKIEYKQPYHRKYRTCEHCAKRYYNLKEFLSHVKKHGEENPTKQICKYCSLEFISADSLKMHMRTHNNIHRKTIDNDVETTKKGTRKILICPECGAKFGSSSNLKVHMRRHSKNYQCYCHDCGKGFCRKFDLIEHIRNHTGERPYPCPYCQYRFSRRNILNRHIKLHTGEKPYKCKFCSNRYKLFSELKYHLDTSKRCLKIRNEMAPAEERLTK